MIGHIHSTESFGTVDGPGVRFVVFFQGCPLRCKYCHNPDTWEFGKGTERTAEDLMKEYDSYKEFLKSGGITATGGEPLAQPAFWPNCSHLQKAREFTPVLTHPQEFMTRTIMKPSTRHCSTPIW